MLGAASFTVATAATPHEGAIPSVGPAGTYSDSVPVAAPRDSVRSADLRRAAPLRPGRGSPAVAPSGGAGGLLSASAPSAELVTLLRTDADEYTWVAAAVGSNSAAGYQLASDLPVMSIGGFNGTDPSPTLAEFQADVAADKIHYFIAGGGFGGRRQADLHRARSAAG